MLEFQKYIHEYNQKWYSLKQNAEASQLEDDRIVQNQLEAYQLIGRLFEECWLFRVREAGL